MFLGNTNAHTYKLNEFQLLSVGKVKTIPKPKLKKKKKECYLVFITLIDMETRSVTKDLNYVMSDTKEFAHGLIKQNFHLRY